MKRTCKSILKITVFIFHWVKYENISLSVWIYSLNSKIAEEIDNTSQEYKTRSEDLLKFLNWDNLATRRDKMLCFLKYDIISLWLLISYTKKVTQFLRELFPMSSKNNSYKSRSDLNIVRRKSNLNIVIIRDPQTARFDFLLLGVEISPSRIEIS